MAEGKGLYKISKKFEIRVLSLKSKNSVLMKKIIFALLAGMMVCQPADAQFFKKIFKKKAKTEKKVQKSTDGIDDDA